MGLSCAPKQVGFPDPETSMLGADVALLWGPGAQGSLASLHQPCLLV